MPRSSRSAALRFMCGNVKSGVPERMGFVLRESCSCFVPIVGNHFTREIRKSWHRWILNRQKFLALLFCTQLYYYHSTLPYIQWAAPSGINSKLVSELICRTQTYIWTLLEGAPQILSGLWSIFNRGFRHSFTWWSSILASAGVYHRATSNTSHISYINLV